MGDISPVLEAFFRGQQQQSSIIQQAREIQNTIAERQQRQQQIDEVIKQHGVENKRDQARVDLETQLHKLNFAKAQEDVTNKFRAALQDESIPIHMAIPGIEAPPVPQGGAVQFPIPGVSVPPEASPTQTMASPLDGNPITIPTPKTNRQLSVEQQQALIPGHVLQKQLDNKADLEKATALFKSTKEPQYLAQIDAANQRNEDNNQRARDIADQRFQLGQVMGEMRAGQHLNDLTGGLIGAPLEEHLDKAVAGAATGHYDSSKEPYPKIKLAIRNRMLASGLDPDIPDKTFANIYSTANGAVDLKNTVDAMNTAIKAPKNFTGRIADLVSGGVGYKGLGVDKSTYDMFTAKLAPTIEIASGVSPGSMRSTTLLNMFKGLVRQPGDSADVVAKKDYMAIGIPLTAVSKQMSALPQEQRKLVWTQVIKDNPRLMTMHPEVARSLAKAATTGRFEPGKDLMDFIANANK